MTDRVERVKASGYFKVKDLILYAIVALAVAGAFLGVFLTDKKTDAEKLELYYREKLLYTYDFSEKNGIMTDSGKNYLTITARGDDIIVSITVPEGKNVLTIYRGGAKMTEADCSTRADCVRSFGKITRGGEAIYCLPHKIEARIVGKNGEEAIL